MYLTDTVVFDEESPNWNKSSKMNSMFLRAQENYWNHVVQSRGHVFLNEILDSLGLTRIVVGQFVGWGENDVIDFGLPEESDENYREVEIHIEAQSILHLLVAS